MGWPTAMVPKNSDDLDHTMLPATIAPTLSRYTQPTPFQ